MDFPTVVNGFLDVLTWAFRAATMLLSYIIVWRTAWFANSTNQVPPWGRMAYQISVFFLIATALNYAPAYLTQQTTKGLERTRMEQEALNAELDYWVRDIYRSTSEPTPGGGDVTISPVNSPTPANVGGGMPPTPIPATPTPVVIVATQVAQPTPIPPTATPAIPTLTPTIDPHLWNPMTPAPPPPTATRQGGG